MMSLLCPDAELEVRSRMDEVRRRYLAKQEELNQIKTSPKNRFATKHKSTSLVIHALPINPVYSKSKAKSGSQKRPRASSASKSRARPAKKARKSSSIKRYLASERYLIL